MNLLVVVWCTYKPSTHIKQQPLQSPEQNRDREHLCYPIRYSVHVPTVVEIEGRQGGYDAKPALLGAHRRQLNRLNEHYTSTHTCTHTAICTMLRFTYVHT